MTILSHIIFYILGIATLEAVLNWVRYREQNKINKWADALDYSCKELNEAIMIAQAHFLDSTENHEFELADTWALVVKELARRRAVKSGIDIAKEAAMIAKKDELTFNQGLDS